MTSATKKIEIIDIEKIPIDNHNTFEMTVIHENEEESVSLESSKVAPCISSITEYTESEIRRRAVFSLSSTSLPMESILGEHEVTEGWISRYLKD